MRTPLTRIIVSGSRSLTDQTAVANFILTGLEDLRRVLKISLSHLEIVHGAAPNGVDLITDRWAKLMNMKVTPFPADWSHHKKAAGFIRNGYMADYGHALIAIWDGASNGTFDMIDKAEAKRLPIVCYVLNTETHRQTSHRFVTEYADD